MKILRSILATVVGTFVAMMAIMAIETVNFLLFKPADAPGFDDLGKLFEWSMAFQEDAEKLNAWVKSLPMEAMLLLLLAWSVGAFAGGWAAARIAGWAVLLHAGLIGALVLFGVAMNFYTLKTKHNISHPDWLIILGLLLPLPLSLLAGKTVALFNSSPLADNP